MRGWAGEDHGKLAHADRSFPLDLHFPQELPSPQLGFKSGNRQGSEHIRQLRPNCQTQQMCSMKLSFINAKWHCSHRLLEENKSANSKGSGGIDEQYLGLRGQVPGTDAPTEHPADQQRWVGRRVFGANRIEPNPRDLSSLPHHTDNIRGRIFGQRHNSARRAGDLRQRRHASAEFYWVFFANPLL